MTSGLKTLSEYRQRRCRCQCDEDCSRSWRRKLEKPICQLLQMFFL